MGLPVDYDKVFDRIKLKLIEILKNIGIKIENACLKVKGETGYQEVKRGVKLGCV